MQKPHGSMSATQLVALFADQNRHRLALGHELRCAPSESIVTLAYGELAPVPLADVPDDLACLAYDEMERRQAAKARLLADNPLLRALVAA